MCILYLNFAFTNEWIYTCIAVTDTFAKTEYEMLKIVSKPIQIYLLSCAKIDFV